MPENKTNASSSPPTHLVNLKKVLQKRSLGIGKTQHSEDNQFSCFFLFPKEEKSVMRTYRKLLIDIQGTGKKHKRSKPLSLTEY